MLAATNGEQTISAFFYSFPDLATGAMEMVILDLKYATGNGIVFTFNMERQAVYICLDC